VDGAEVAGEVDSTQRECVEGVGAAVRGFAILCFALVGAWGTVTARTAHGLLVLHRLAPLTETEEIA